MLTSDSGVLFENFYFSINGEGNSLDDEFAGTITASGDAISGSVVEADTLDPTRNCDDEIYCTVSNTAAQIGPLTGTIVPGVSLTLNGNMVDPNGETWTASALYDDPSPLSALVGTWNGFWGGEAQNNPFVIAADGSFTEQDTPYSVGGQTGNCTISGQFSTDDPTHNLYSVSLAYTGSLCILEGAASGIAYIDYSQDPEVLWIGATAGDYLIHMAAMPD
jgi:hypothetical protein